MGGIILENHSKSCMRDALLGKNKDKVLEELMDTVQRFLKFVD
ncbi:MAG: hypothetical protein ACOX7R_06185 [Acetivibrionales bacterium]